MKFLERIKNWLISLFQTDEDVEIERSRNLEDVQRERVAAERARREQLEKQLQEIDAQQLEESMPHMQALAATHEKFESQRQVIMNELQPLLGIKRCSKGSGITGPCGQCKTKDDALPRNLFSDEDRQ